MLEEGAFADDSNKQDDACTSRSCAQPVQMQAHPSDADGGTTSSSSRQVGPIENGAEPCAAEKQSSSPRSKSPVDYGSAEVRSGTDTASTIMLRLVIVDGTGVERREEIRAECSATVGDLKARHFQTEMAQGLLPKLIFQGRLLPDTKPLHQLAHGSFIQCYLQKQQVTLGASDSADLFVAWARLACAAGGTSCRKWQDLTFHAVFAVGLALAWSAYMTDVQSFDIFSRFALWFFSSIWAVVCFADITRRGGEVGDLRAVTISAQPSASSQSPP